MSATGGTEGSRSEILQDVVRPGSRILFHFGLPFGVGMAGFGSWLMDVLSHPVAAVRFGEAAFTIAMGLVQFGKVFFPLAVVALLGFRRLHGPLGGRVIWVLGVFAASLTVARFTGVRLLDAGWVDSVTAWIGPACGAVVVALGAAGLDAVVRRRGGAGSDHPAWTTIPVLIVTVLACSLAANVRFEALHTIHGGIYGLIGTLVLLIVVVAVPARYGDQRPVRLLVLLGAGVGALLAVAFRLTLWVGDLQAWAAFPKDANPKLFLLTADTLRGDAPHFMNPAAHETPGMDGLARDGFVFEKACSAAPWTLPSFASIMTGQTSGVHQVVMVSRILSDRFETLAEILRAQGYRTEAMIQNYFLRDEHGFDQGFDRYFMTPVDLPDFQWNMIARWAARWPGSYAGADMNARLRMDVQRFFERRAGRPFFLWAHFLDPHSPFAPTLESLEKVANPLPGLRRHPCPKGQIKFSDQERREMPLLYRAEVLDLDRALRSLFDSMRRSCMYQTTSIVFTSDHGEAFWEHGQFYHGSALHKEQIHVPLIVKLSGKNPQGRRTDEPVSNARIFATFLDLAGLETPVDVIEGKSLLDWIGKSNPERIPVHSAGVSVDVPPQVAIIADGFKFIQSESRINPERLYDIHRDFMEADNLASGFASKVAEFSSRLALHAKLESELAERLEIRPDDITIELDDEDLTNLQELGYVE